MHSSILLPVNFKAFDTSIPFSFVKPNEGSIVTVMIFSGVFSATASISIPPSVDATNEIREVVRSNSTAR